MVKLAGRFSHFKPFRALVVGDFMLDTYTRGQVRRISPEAPVSILKVEGQESRPGGAGNVVLNLISLGGEVLALGRIGNDAAGKELKRRLEEEGTNIQGLLVEKGFQTPVKNRLIADSQQVLRVDLEKVTPLSSSLEKKIEESLSILLSEIDVVAISDYNKGFLSPSLLQTIIQRARKKKIPVIVDPKGEDLSKYKGATLLKPNLLEAYIASKLPQTEPLEKAAETLLRDSQADLLMITRSAAGISLFTPDGKRKDFPVLSKEVKDVTGAGDTVLAMISAALANGIDMDHAIPFANIAAGISIERLGCVRITLPELARRLLEYDLENKIFDERHLFALKQILEDKQYSILCLDTSKGMDAYLFHAIRKLSSEMQLLIYIEDKNPNEEFISLLSSLHEVDFIILKKENLKNLFDEISPQQIFAMGPSGIEKRGNLSPLLK